MSPTRSPGCSPLARNIAATRALASSSSGNDTFVSPSRNAGFPSCALAASTSPFAKFVIASDSIREIGSRVQQPLRLPQPRQQRSTYLPVEIRRRPPVAHALRTGPTSARVAWTRGRTLMTTTVRGLEELKALAGKSLGSSGWLEITQDRVNTFAEATGDHQWIHVDVERAKSGPFGGTIAHGYLTLSLIIPLFTELLDVQDVKMGVNYGLEKVRFPSPVRVGSRIRLNARVQSVQEVAGNGVQTQFDFTIEVDGSDRPACIAQALYRHY